MVNIKLENISKSYRNLKALNNISFEIKDKEYFIILGPTGAGKTTLVKIIAGLLKQDGSGKIIFDGKDVSDRDSGERNLGFMFENYALFPHMNIVDNISYSGRVHDRNKDQTKSIVEQFLLMTHLLGRNDAFPEELSGGMKQRVALSRSLMNLEQTKLLILDEPLKALDAGLRMSLRRDLQLMARQLELTVIHITNNEREAMMLADRIAIINEGHLIQVGTPYEIYYRPKNLFVAYFMSEINYFEGVCLKNPENKVINNTNNFQGDELFTQLKKDSIALKVDLGLEKKFITYVRKRLFDKLNNQDKVLIVTRSNHMKIRLGNRVSDKENSFFGTIIRRKFMGVVYRFEVKININGLEKIIIVTDSSTAEIHNKFQEGVDVTIYFPKEFGILFKHPGTDEINRVLKLE
ncbi:MAG: ABC transporter ATP-binding protein [Candidatus Lokiarchaeota archaeon]